MEMLTLSILRTYFKDEEGKIVPLFCFADPEVCRHRLVNYGTGSEDMV